MGCISGSGFCGVFFCFCLFCKVRAVNTLFCDRWRQKQEAGLIARNLGEQIRGINTEFIYGSKAASSLYLKKCSMWNYKTTNISECTWFNGRSLKQWGQRIIGVRNKSGQVKAKSPCPLEHPYIWWTAYLKVLEHSARWFCWWLAPKSLLCREGFG